MTALITPRKLAGTVVAPPSKSYAHRALIAAALCFSKTVKVNNVALSADIEATMDALRAVGAAFVAKKQPGGRYSVLVSGISTIPESAEINCNESGSTLRFIIPICAALGIRTTFTGRGKLPFRPIDTYLRELEKHGITFERPADSYLPLKMSGRLSGGSFRVEGNISSQFVSGLMFALPLCGEDSQITIDGELQSSGYAEMTAGTLKKFGVVIERDARMNCSIKGSQKYFCAKMSTAVENDRSQAAFFYTANFLGSRIDVKCTGGSVQPDAVITDILESLSNGSKSSFSVAECPDILPILTVAASLSGRTVKFTNAERLAVKESNRLKTSSDMINALGGKAEFTADTVIISPITEFSGGTVDGAGDHRIVMSAAIAAVKSNAPVKITDAEAVAKSYPDFWEVYEYLGGAVEMID
jgi:3-phosphoshikimate 1-carboxyvinyltransferase